MAQDSIDREDRRRASRAGSRPLRSRLPLAIMGMVLALMMAVALVLQEGGELVGVDHHGHLYSPFIRHMTAAHRPAPAPASPAHSNDPAPGAPSRD
jgi:hypothetical protein